jgi:hypothetical protein
MKKYNDYLAKKCAGFSNKEVPFETIAPVTVRKKNTNDVADSSQKTFESLRKQIHVLQEQNRIIHEEFRVKAIEFLQKQGPNVDKVTSDLIQSYAAQEKILMDRLESSSYGSMDDQVLMINKVRKYIQEVQMKLESEKYLLMSKCAALEKELGY